MSSPGHEWTKHERDGWSVCSRCGMVRNYDRETTTCSGALPKIRQRSEIEDCGQDGVCRLSPGCNRHWEERNRELVRERDEARAFLRRTAMTGGSIVSSAAMTATPNPFPPVFMLPAIVLRQRFGQQRNATPTFLPWSCATA